MRVTKIVLGLAGFLLLSLIFISFQAAATHPAQSWDGLANGPFAPVGSNIGDEGLEHWDDAALDAIVAHNPLCPPHAATHTDG